MKEISMIFYILLILSMDQWDDLEEEINRFQEDFVFLGNTNGVVVLKIKIVDLSGKEIWVYYHDEKETIAKLMEYYHQATKDITEVNFQVYGRPYFAKPNETIKFYTSDKATNNPTFKAIKKDGSQPSMSQIPQQKILKLILKGIDIDQVEHVANTLTVKKLKEILAEKVKIDVNEFKFVSKEKQLENQYTLEKYNLDNGDVIYVFKKMINGCFRANTNLLSVSQTGKLEYTSISSLRKGASIISYDLNSQKTVEDTITFMESVSVKTYVKISMSNGFEIQCTPNHSFLCQDGCWRSCETSSECDDQIKIRKGTKLQMMDGKYSEVCEISWQNLENAELFYHPSVEKNHNFIVGGGFISHNMEIFIKFVDKENKKPIKFNFDPGMLIFDVKKFIEENLGIEMENQKLLWSGKTLEDFKSLTDYGINKGQSIYLIKLGGSSIIPNDGGIKITKTKSVEIIKHDKNIILQISPSETLKLSYEMEKNKLVSQIVREYVPNATGYYCLLYGHMLLQPYDKFQKIREDQSFDSSEELSVKVSSSATKYCFGKQLQKVEFNRNSLALGESKKIVDKFLASNRDNRPAITYLSTSEFSVPLRNYLINFLDSGEQFAKMRHFCSALITEMETLPKQKGFVYRGIKGMKFSSHQKVGDKFSQGVFLSCSTQLQVARRYINKGDTIMKIRSITGRNIRKYSIQNHGDEIVFYPFTYFLVNKITQKQNYEEVELVELETPLYWKNKLIVWVDDHPENNIKEIAKVKKDDMEIIELVSTKDAEVWMKEFGWFLHWSNIKYKIISDMVRTENGRENYQAGADLIENLFSHSGVTTPIMIYCGNKERAQSTINKRNIRPHRVHRVSSNFREVTEFGNNFN